MEISHIISLTLDTLNSLSYRYDNKTIIQPSQYDSCYTLPH